MRKLTLVFLIILLYGRFHAQNETSAIDCEIWNGQFQMANKKIDVLLGKNDILDAKLLKLKGDIAKSVGDIEMAFKFWNQSNISRSKAYSKNNYHLAWNYALMSNYHYEKINNKLCISYADSCVQLILGLNTSQQKEIEIFKIWNILGQSYKLTMVGESPEKFEAAHERGQSYYLKSVAFIQKNNLDEHFLAETFRLLGNSFNDLTVFTMRDNESKATYYFLKSSAYYSKATTLFQKIYGSRHYQLARTHFVHGLLYYYTNSKLDKNTDEKAIAYLESSIESYGVKLNYGSSVNFENIPNQQDFMMTCKYLMLAYFREFKTDSSKKWIEKAHHINQIAINAWEKIHQSFKGDNTNQNLAIYNLVPFSETITIEMFKKELGLDYSLNKIFSANQKLKHYDLLKYGSEGNNVSAEINISELQKRLKRGEVFLDFHISLNTNYIIVLRITNETTELIELPYLENGLVEGYLKAIQTFDFDKYTNSAYKIYQGILEPCKVGGNNLILCLDGWLNSIPFEALLTSKNNWNKKDYRKLDYMLMINRIQYVLNPQLFRKQQPANSGFHIEAFVPNNSNYSSLPFSEQLGVKLQSEFSAKVHSLTGATKQNFLKMNSPIVHLSGHGMISSEDMMSSYLVFTDSMLYLDNLTELKNVPDLIVLNTCNSSNGKMYYGEGVKGFVRTLNTLGVKSVLSNLLEVDDQASNQILERFYILLREGKSTIESLYLAQIVTVRQAQNSTMAAPYYWAGHKVVGDEIVFENVGDQQGSDGVCWLLALGIIGSGIFLWRRKFKTKSS